MNSADAFALSTPETRAAAAENAARMPDPTPEQIARLRILLRPRTRAAATKAA